jgi:hypothetical protein
MICDGLKNTKKKKKITHQTIFNDMSKKIDEDVAIFVSRGFPSASSSINLNGNSDPDENVNAIQKMFREGDNLKITIEEGLNELELKFKNSPNEDVSDLESEVSSKIRDLTYLSAKISEYLSTHENLKNHQKFKMFLLSNNYFHIFIYFVYICS